MSLYLLSHNQRKKAPIYLNNTGYQIKRQNDVEERTETESEMGIHLGFNVNKYVKFAVSFRTLVFFFVKRDGGGA